MEELGELEDFGEYIVVPDMDSYSRERVCST